MISKEVNYSKMKYLKVRITSSMSVIRAERSQYEMGSTLHFTNFFEIIHKFYFCFLKFQF